MKRHASTWHWWSLPSIVAASLGAAAAPASFLQMPHVGGRDGGLSGNVVATPVDPGSTLLINPAGVVDGAGTEVSASIAAGTMSGRYTNPQTGYDEKSNESGFMPLLWVRSDRLAPWYVGAGVYGNVGSSFNFAADPAAGIPARLLAESGLAQMSFVVGRELLPGLRMGAQVGPTWGRIRMRAPSPLGNVQFDVSGFGVAGSAGLVYDLAASTSVGLAYRSPGIVYMGGDGEVGGADEDVSIDFHLPQSVAFGVAHRLGARLTVTAQATWTDYPQFESGVFEFEHNPQLDRKFIENARDTFRYGAAVEYAWTDWLSLRGGFSREEWMIEASAVSPLLYDTTDTMLMAGLGLVRGKWAIDAAVGMAFMEDRLVTPTDQQAFPGRYQLETGPALTVQATYRFGGE